MGNRETIILVSGLVSQQIRTSNLLAKELWVNRREQLIEPWWAGIKIVEG